MILNNLVNYKEIKTKQSFEKLKDEISVLLFSFNHEKTIKKTIESILTQQISIPIKIFCFDDGSKDKTQEILKEYESYNKQKIKLIFSKINTKLPFDLVLKSEINFNTKYWCMIDGDDWWIDNNNLNKKIRKLSTNKKIIGCASSTIILDENQTNISIIRPTKNQFNKLDLIINSNTHTHYCHTSSIVWKNYFYNKKNKLPFPYNYNKIFSFYKSCEWFIFNQMLNLGHEIFILDHSMSVYNMNKKGAWSQLSDNKKKKLNFCIAILNFFYAPMKYKIFYIIVNLSRFSFIRSIKLLKFGFKIFKIEPINKI
jgi:glycosyltransferase involved in cell wall biosynthesis